MAGGKSMLDVVQRYEDLMDQLVWRRAIGSLTADEEDDLLGNLDVLWNDMTQQEIDRWRQTWATRRVVAAPESLRLVDCDVDGSSWSPRKAS
jgi:hypothetical protein